MTNLKAGTLVTIVGEDHMYGTSNLGEVGCIVEPPSWVTPAASLRLVQLATSRIYFPITSLKVRS